MFNESGKFDKYPTRVSRFGPKYYKLLYGEF